MCHIPEDITVRVNKFLIKIKVYKTPHNNNLYQVVCAVLQQYIRMLTERYWFLVLVFIQMYGKNTVTCPNIFDFNFKFGTASLNFLKDNALKLSAIKMCSKFLYKNLILELWLQIALVLRCGLVSNLDSFIRFRLLNSLSSCELYALNTYETVRETVPSQRFLWPQHVMCHWEALEPLCWKAQSAAMRLKAQHKSGAP